MNNAHKTFRFKTTIHCGGCVAKVSPFLNQAQGIAHWEVDTSHANKILSVRSEGITENEIMQNVEAAGFKIEPLNNDIS